MTTTTFDTLQFSKRAIDAGFSSQQAEFQAEEMATLLDRTVVTRDTLKRELIGLERRMQAFQFRMSWTVLGGLATVITALQTLFYFSGQ